MCFLKIPQTSGPKLLAWGPLVARKVLTFGQWQWTSIIILRPTGEEDVTSRCVYWYSILMLHISACKSIWKFIYNGSQFNCLTPTAGAVTVPWDFLRLSVDLRALTPGDARFPVLASCPESEWNLFFPLDRLRQRCQEKFFLHLIYTALA